MKNTIVFSKSRFLSLHHAFVFSLMLALGSLLITTLNGCSAGPDDGKPSLGSVTTTIYGRITDEAGKSLQGVSVAAGTQTATTDANGIFILRNATVPEGRAVIIAKKAGYFHAARAEEPSKSGITRMQLSMMSNTPTKNVSGSGGGTVTISGASVKFEAGSFTDASGKAYTGTVSVAARYLDPKNETFFDYFSGDDYAQTSDGKNVSLISSGVLRVELQGSAGEALTLDPSKPATLSFPKPIDPKAPANMPLWYFDESIGMWKAEGSATLNGANYTGTVTHFTDWNLDYFDSTGSFGVYGDVNLRVVCNGAPVSGVAVSIVGDDVPGKYFVHPGGTTGKDGRLHFIRFPANRPTQIEIRSTKNNGLYFINTPISVNLTPGQNLDLGDISLNSPCPATIKGTLTGCDDSKIEGLVVISDGTNINYIYSKEGDFAVQVPSGVSLNIDAMDASGNQATTITAPPLLSDELRDVGQIKICGSLTSTFIDIDLGTAKEGQMIVLSPDGSRLAAYTYQPTSKITVYDTKTGTELCAVTLAPNTYGTSMQFSVDNTKLLLSSSYGATTLYDVSGASATLITSIPNIISAKLYDDGSKIIAGVYKGSGTSEDLNTYSAVDGSLLGSQTPVNFNTSDSTASFAFIRDEESIAYLDSKTGGLARVWNVPGNSELRTFAMIGDPYTFNSSEDGSVVASTLDYITYSFYNTKTGQKINDIKTAGSNGTRYGNIVMTKNYVYISDQITGGQIVRIINLANGTSTIKLTGSTNYAYAVAASRNEQYLAATTGKTIRIWKLN